MVATPSATTAVTTTGAGAPAAANPGTGPDLGTITHTTEAAPGTRTVQTDCYTVRMPEGFREDPVEDGTKNPKIFCTGPDDPSGRPVRLYAVAENDPPSSADQQSEMAELVALGPTESMTEDGLVDALRSFTPQRP